jgi:glutamate-1-semialdehyde 2,1-aminomutase
MGTPVQRTPIESSSDGYAQLNFSHGSGAYCWTVDGRRYIDLVCGQGPVILGHAHPAVTAAVTHQLQRGILLPGPGPALAELRQAVLDLYPVYDDVLTFKTGSEAVAAAIRLCRAYTGRSKILRVGFHGWHDQLVSPYMRCHSYDETLFERSWPRGVPHIVYRPLTEVWHGFDPAELLSLVRASGESLAAIIVDPVQLRPPGAQSVAVQLAAEARRLGALLVFDESKTGFRVHLGGVQALYGMTADLTILSKALANGLPLAVILGQSQLTGLEASIRIKGTFRFELTAIVAALATIRTLQETAAPQRLAERGAELLDGLNAAFREAGYGRGIRAVPYHWPCLPYIHFKQEAAGLKGAFYRGMLKNGILMMQSHMNYISLALTREDVHAIIAAAKETLPTLTRS